MKRVMTTILASMMALSLIGCGSTDTKELANEEKITSAVSEIVTDVASESPENEQEVTSDKPLRDKPLISVIARGKDTDFWKDVQSGIEDAAKDYDVDYVYEVADNEIASFQLSRLVKSQIEQMPDALLISPISYDDIYAPFKTAKKKGIPVVTLDSGKRDDVTGATVATCGIDNYEAGKEAADLLFSNPEVISQLTNGTMESPVNIGCMSQDALTESIITRTSGFIDEAFKICSEYGETAIEGHDIWAKPNDDATIIIEISITETTDKDGMAYSSEVLCSLDKLLGIFATSEPCVNALVAYKNSNARYADVLNDIPVYGFDAGETQRKAVKDGFIRASFGQEAYRVGYTAMELAVKAAKNEEVDNVIIPYIKYDKTNIDDSSVVEVLFK